MRNDNRELQERLYGLAYNLPMYIREVINTFEVRGDKSIETAATSLSEQPILLINPDFVDEYCKSDEHLLMLVLHEAFHVILGHTRIFGKRSTFIDNIVFDAVINSLLVKLFPESRYTSFFKNLNPSSSLPGCLLRPLAYDTPKEAIAILNRLYGGETATYGEIYELIKKELAKRIEKGDFILIGDHVEEKELSPYMKKLVGELFDSISHDKQFQIDAGFKGIFHKEAVLKNADMQMKRRLSLLLSYANIIPKKNREQLEMHHGESFAYQYRDRRAAIKRQMNETLLPIYKKEIAHVKNEEKKNKAHVYVDVSGSMDKELPFILPLLGRLEEEGRCLVYQFSEVVEEATFADLEQGKYLSSGGTDVNSIFDHYFSSENRNSKIVIITDGQTKAISDENLRKINSAHTEIFVGGLGNYVNSEMKKIAKRNIVLWGSNV